MENPHPEFRRPRCDLQYCRHVIQHCLFLLSRNSSVKGCERLERGVRLELTMIGFADQRLASLATRAR